MMFAALAGSLFLLTSLPVSQGDVEVYMVDVGEYLLGPTAFDFDSPLAWTLGPSTEPARRDHDVMAYSANAQSYMVARGTDLGTGMFKVPVYTGLNGSSDPDDLDHCGAWLNAVHWDQTQDRVRGFYHQEWKCNYSHSAYTNMSIAYSESRDGGLTFTKPGHPHNSIITAPNSSATHITGEGGHGMAVRGDYYYIYFRDWSTFGVGVARATIASGGVPGSWWKYHEGEWSQPGLHGNASSLDNITGTAVHYSKTKLEFVSVGYWNPGHTVGHGPRLSYSADGLEWRMAQYPLQPLDPQVWNRTEHQPEEYAYQTLAPTGTSDDIMAGHTFYFSYTFVEPGSTRVEKYLCRKLVTMNHIPSSPSWPGSQHLHNRSQLHPTDNSNTSTQSRPAPAAGAPATPVSLLHLGYYVSNGNHDVWVTTAAVPPHHGYKRSHDFNDLGLLASADWTMPEQPRQQQQRQQQRQQQLVHRGREGEAEFPSSLNILLEHADVRLDELDQDRFAPKENDALMLPVFDCVCADDNDHFVSEDKTCRGHTYLRILGYVVSQHAVDLLKTADATADSRFALLRSMPMSPIYKCYDDSRKNSCLEDSAQCSQCGGNSIGLLGYGITPPPPPI